MRKIIQFVLLAVAVVWPGQPALAQAGNTVGTLTLYYAKKNVRLNFENYVDTFKVGNFIMDSNNPCNTITSLNQSYYEITEGEFGYSDKLLKSSVTTKQYSMNRLPVDLIGQEAVFVDKNGHKARIFRSSNNGHRFQPLSIKIQQEKRKNPGLYDSDTDLPSDKPIPGEGCYVLSVDDGSPLFEEPLSVTNGFIDLYFHDTSLSCYCCTQTGRLIGALEDVWVTPESWPQGKSAYDAQGRLLTNLEQYYNSDMPWYDIFPVAYIAAEDALYVKGTLYYRQK